MDMAVKEWDAQFQMWYKIAARAVCMYIYIYMDMYMFICICLYGIYLCV